MTTTAFAGCGEYVEALSQTGLVGPGERERLAEFIRKSRTAGPKELAGFLLQQGMLTRFQADYVIEGRAADLTLAAYTLVDVVGTGTMGAVYKARSAKDGGWYAVKVVPRRNVVNL